MKKLLLLLVLIGISQLAASQVGINTTSPNAQLDIKSSNQATPANNDGILIPKIDAFPLTNPTAAQQGMLVYLTTVSGGKQPGFYYWDNTGTPQWKGFGEFGWNLTGNSGTDATINFLGTTDDIDVVFKRNNTRAGLLGNQWEANTSFGLSAYNPLSIGVNNSAFGYNALASITEGNMNTAIGAYSLSSITEGIGNTGVGLEALTLNINGGYNTGIGIQSLANNIDGMCNVASGGMSLLYNKNGSYNTAIGYSAMILNSSSENNVAIGHAALALNGFTNGNVRYEGNNIAIGRDAMYNNYSTTVTNGVNNVAVGGYSLRENITGFGNATLGHNSLRANTIGENNVAVGFEALRWNYTGLGNVAVGYKALDSQQTGSYNTCVGYNVDPTSSTAVTNYTGVGYNVGGVTSLSNMVELGNTSVATIRAQVTGITAYSDRRIKNDIQENVPGLKFITKLRPVTYRLDIHKQNEILYRDKKNSEADWPGKYDIEKIIQTGFIAQEVADAAKATGYDFNGVNIPEKESELYTLNYTGFVMPLVKAVQEQQEIIEIQNKKITLLEKTNEEILKRLKLLEQ